MKWNRWLYLFAAVLFFASPGLEARIEGANAAATGALALSRVTLYKNGMGYFERRGSVREGEAVELFFKQEQMNDLLKSLTLINLSGGSIQSVVYDSTKTPEQLMAEFSFDIRREHGLPQMLGQLQGVPIRVISGNTHLRGTIAGIESRTRKTEGGETPAYYLNLLETEGRLRSIGFEAITAVELLDEGLLGDLQRYFNILFQKHLKAHKRVLITAGGKGKQDIWAGYVTESPVWKATYRVVIRKNTEAGNLFLQGWAIVDNVSGEDWKEVRLSLVSGRPISFIQDLYAPLFKKRPVVEMERDAGAAPVTHEAGETLARAQGAQQGQPLRAMSLARSPLAPGVDMRLEEKEGLDDDRIQRGLRQLRAEAETRQVGELFEYRIDHPVTIENNRSSLVPIIAGEVEGQAVSIYNESARPGNPLAGIRLVNTTGLTLEGGPLTVIHDANYAGEALIQTIRPKETRYITYAVDLGLQVDTKHGSDRQRVDRVVINKGVLRTHRAVVATKSYNLNNKTDRTKSVIIEHPRRPGRELLNKEKPIELTENYLRFEVEAAASKWTTFTVRESEESWESFSITSLTPEDILLFTRNAYLSKPAEEQLKRIMAIKSRIVDIQREIHEIETARKRIFEDQKRLGDNLRGLGHTPEEKNLRNRYINRLDTQENRLEALNDRQRDLDARLLSERKDLDAAIESLEQDLLID